MFKRDYKKWHEKRMKEIQQENQYQEMLAEQKALKSKYKTKITTSKLIMFWIFINCSIIELFSMYITYEAIVLTQTVDMSAIVALIGAVIGESLSYFIYTLKATKENTQGGITYEMAMKEQTTITKDEPCG